MSAIGAVIHDHARHAVAAIAVAAPTSRCPRAKFREFAPHVTEAARVVGAAL